MQTRRLHLFPDTNVFIQCKSLSDCDWSFLSDVDEVRLIVSRPVQKEIDGQKNRGNDRVGRRAREAASLFRELLQTESDKVIRESSPRVTLSVGPEFNYAGHRADVLNLTEPDEQLVGCVLNFLGRHPQQDARVLTDDGGPMGAAKLVGVRFVAVPENWKPTPEATGDERRVQELQREVARLKSSEPLFSVECHDQRDQPLATISAVLPRRAALTDSEIDLLIGELTARFPLVVDFDRHAAVGHHPLHGVLGNNALANYAYAPPEPEDIKEYTDEYPKWIAASQNVLRNLHKRIVSSECQFSIGNDGNRPGTNVKVEFVAHGNFLIMPGGEDADDLNELLPKSAFRSPPKAPQGQWTLAGFASMTRTLDQFNRQFAKQFDELRLMGPRALTPYSMADFGPRDAEAFYCGSQPRVPVRSYELDCQRWRHGREPETFFVRLFPKSGTEAVEGALQCQIHADNLSQPVERTVPVRLSIKSENIMDFARALMAEIGSEEGDKE